MSNHVTQYDNQTILITGGAGAIGMNLTRTLLEADIKKIVILDDLSSSFEWNIPTDEKGRVTFIKGSVRNDADIKKAFDHKPNYVFHLAALFANQNSIDHPQDDLMINGMGTLKILEACRDSHDAGVLKRFVFASSGCSVYGSEAPLPLTEDFISIHLDTPYQITKLLGELYCNFFYNFYKLPVSIPRFFNSYGPGEVPGKYRNVIPIFFYKAMKGEKLSVFGTGEETRDFTFVGDLINGLLAAGVDKNTLGEAFNLASQKETDIKTLAQKIATITGSKGGYEITGELRDWDKISRRCASVEKAQKLFGYDPSTDLDTGLVSVHEWFKEHWDKIEESASFE